MSHTVTLLPSGHTYSVGDDESILHAGLAAGFSLPYSCRTGVCNTCKGRVVEGTVDLGKILLSNLSPEARAEGFALLCSTRATSDVVVEVTELEGMEHIEPKVYPCRVSKIDRPASDVAVLSLRLPLNENMRFMAGQYIEIILKDGTRRNYSLATPPKPEGLSHVDLHIRHLPGGLFTDHVFTSLKERDLLKFEGPFGTFYLRRDSEKPVILLVSGTGFAPAKSIVEDAIRRNVTRDITIYWGGRVRSDLYMAQLAETWAAEHSNITFVPVLSNASAACDWVGREGFVHQAVLEDYLDLSGHQVYACGAPAMVDAARADFVTHRRLPADQFFADSFLTAKERAATS